MRKTSTTQKPKHQPVAPDPKRAEVLTRLDYFLKRIPTHILEAYLGPLSQRFVADAPADDGHGSQRLAYNGRTFLRFVDHRVPASPEEAAIAEIDALLPGFSLSFLEALGEELADSELDECRNGAGMIE